MEAKKVKDLRWVSNQNWDNHMADYKMIWTESGLLTETMDNHTNELK